MRMRDASREDLDDLVEQALTHRDNGSLGEFPASMQLEELHSSKDTAVNTDRCNSIIIIQPYTASFYQSFHLDKYPEKNAKPEKQELNRCKENTPCFMWSLHNKENASSSMIKWQAS